MNKRLLISLVFAANLLISASANATSIITENFIATVNSGTFAGTVGTGTFTYDDAMLTGIGGESVSFDSGNLMVNFNVFGQDFTNADDIDFTGFPLLSFLDGSIQSLDYIVAEAILGPDNATDILQAGVLGFSIFELTAALQGGFTAVLSVDEAINPVPLPAAAWLFGSAMLGFIGLRRRKLQQQ